MKQRFTHLLLLTLFCTVAIAGPVDMDKARGIAAKFMLQLNGSTISSAQSPEYAPARTIKGVASETGTPAYYVFNTENQDGYVIVSGEDKTDEILGYSTKGAFDIDNMPSNVKAWFDAYAEQISAMENYIPQQHASAQHSASWTEILPLTTTKWNQGAPYNNLCPIHEDQRSMTGCAATAMAQVMKYHEWPQTVTSSIPGYTTIGHNLELEELAPTTFMWSQMNDEYSTDEAGEAVAELMRYCGQAILSDYSKLFTGASPTYVAQTLPLYFGYDQNLELKEQRFYSISEWEEIIYDELQAKRPVFHAGFSLTGGHGFVCDGYDGNGMFHFNWGWGGYCDGYYKLALMNPTPGGIGSGSADGYSSGQVIITGVQPPTGKPSNPKYLQPINEQTDGVSMIYTGFYNMHFEPVSAQVGFATVDNNNNVLKVLAGGYTGTLDYGSGVPVEVDMKNFTSILGEGTHRIATVCRPDDTHAWKRVGSRQNFFQIVIDENGKIKSLIQSPIIECSFNWDCSGTFVAQMQGEIKLTFANEGEDISTQVFLFASPEFEMGKIRCQTPILLKKNETLEYILSFTPETDGEWNLWLASDREGHNVMDIETIFVKKAPTQPANLTLISCEPDSNELSAVIVVRNNSTEPYYRGLVAEFYECLDDNDYLTMTEKINLPGTIEPGETKTFHAKFNDANSYTECAIRLGYYPIHAEHNIYELGEIIDFTTGETLIENIKTSVTVLDNEPVYRLDGTKTISPKQKGIYITQGKKIIAK